MKKRVKTVSTSIAVIAVAAATVQPAHAFQPIETKPAPVFAVEDARFLAGGLTGAQWIEIESAALAAGDTAAAGAAAQARVTSKPGASTQVIVAAAKAAIRAALTYGRNLLPASIRPWADNILNVLDEINDFTEGAIILTLVQGGVPYPVAVDTARWISLFL